MSAGLPPFDQLRASRDESRLAVSLPNRLADEPPCFRMSLASPPAICDLWPSMRAVWIFATVSLGLVLILFLVREPARWPAPEPVPYQGEAADPGSARHSEVALARLIREPQNTWSNLAFVAGGAVLLGRMGGRLTRMVGVPLIAVGIGSFLYHASASAELRHLDVGAMYWLFVTTLLCCAVAAADKLRPAVERTAPACLAATLAVAVALALLRNVTVIGFKPMSVTVATGVTATVLIGTLANNVRRTGGISGWLQLIGVVATFAAAVFFQVTDRPGGPLYRPDTYVQAHALWHLLAAAAFVWAIRLLHATSDSAARAGPRPH